jgi:TonB family protein
MAGVLLYKSAPRWRIGAALGAAALVHLAAVAFANIHRQVRIDEVSSSPGIPEITFDATSPIDDSTPPPDTAAPTPNRGAIDQSFIDENPSPPSIRRQDNRLVVPRARRGNRSPGSLTFSSAKVLALSAPRPEYPYEARRQKIIGSGIVLMSVDPVSGSVTDISMWQSTGSALLDNAAVTAFRRWRFKPGTVSRVKSPITFTMTGAYY